MKSRSREEILKYLRSGEDVTFFEIPGQFVGDEEIVVESLRKGCWVLQSASEKLRNTKVVVLEAVKQIGISLKYASKELQNEKEIVLSAVENMGASLEYASEELRDDKDVVLAAVKNNGWSLKFASENMQDDKEIALSLNQIGNRLEHVSCNLRNEKDVVLAAVKNYGLSLSHASDRLRRDHDVLLAAWKKHRISIKHFGEDIVRNSPFLTILQKYKGEIETMLENESISDFENDGWKDLFLSKGLQIGSSKVSTFYTLSDLQKEIDVEKEKKEILVQNKKLSAVSFCDLNVFRKLGSGSYATSYLCRVKEMEGVYVVKIYNDPYIEEKKLQDMVRRDCLEIPYHPNIVSILYHKDDEDIDVTRLPDYEEYWKDEEVSILNKSSFVFMKYYREDLSRYQLIKVQDACVILFGVVKGAKHLYDNKFVHRDLHPQNVFIDTETERVWIGDFGCALDLRKNPTGFMVQKDNEQMFSIYGSTDSNSFKRGGYSKCLPPEIRNFDPNSSDNEEYLDYKKCDIYSVGVIGKLLIQKISEEKWGSFGNLLFLMTLEDINLRVGYNDACETLGTMLEKKCKE